jgi:hypothetical protein
MEAARYSETSVNIYQSARRNVQGIENHEPDRTETIREVFTVPE